MPRTSSEKEPPGSRFVLPLASFVQPDEVSCGPACLGGVYRYFGLDVPYPVIVNRTRRNPDGGTQAVYLALTALSHGFHVTLYPFSVRIFDPTWRTLCKDALMEKLQTRAMIDDYARLRTETLAWCDFLKEGGRVAFHELDAALFTRILGRGHPVLCGLCATWLYRSMRERPDDNWLDDLYGRAAGHFVVVSGYSASGRNLHVCDPAVRVPFPTAGRYVVPTQRLLNAILLGDSTGDAVLMELWRRPSRSSHVRD